MLSIKLDCDFSLNEQGNMNETEVGAVEISLAKEVAPHIIEKLEEKGYHISNIDMGIFTRALHHEFMNHKDKYDSSYDREDEINSGLDHDDMMNESIKKIKSNFKRFL